MTNTNTAAHNVCSSGNTPHSESEQQEPDQSHDQPEQPQPEQKKKSGGGSLWLSGVVNSASYNPFVPVGSSSEHGADACDALVLSGSAAGVQDFYYHALPPNTNCGSGSEEVTTFDLMHSRSFGGAGAAAPTSQDGTVFSYRNAHGGDGRSSHPSGSTSRPLDEQILKQMAYTVRMEEDVICCQEHSKRVLEMELQRRQQEKLSMYAEQQVLTSTIDQFQEIWTAQEDIFRELEGLEV